MPTWDADLYLQFAGERTQPSLDLIVRTNVSSPARIIDLGCGQGNSTQIPAHYKSPLHQVTLEVAKDSSWCDRMEAPRNALTEEQPSFYYDVLQPLASRLDIWETEYYHLMDSPQAIVDWFRGTGLRPFLEMLETEEQKQRFQQMLLDGYTQAYPRQKDGRVLFPFRRLFMVAYR